MLLCLFCKNRFLVVGYSDEYCSYRVCFSGYFSGYIFSIHDLKNIFSKDFSNQIVALYSRDSLGLRAIFLLTDNSENPTCNSLEISLHKAKNSYTCVCERACFPVCAFSSLAIK